MSHACSCVSDASLASITPPGVCGVCLGLLSSISSMQAALETALAGRRFSAFCVRCDLSASFLMRARIVGQNESVAERATQQVVDLVRSVRPEWRLEESESAQNVVTIVLRAEGTTADLPALKLEQDAPRGRKSKRRAVDQTRRLGLSKTVWQNSVSRRSTAELRQQIASYKGGTPELLAEPEIECFGPDGYCGGRYRKLARNVSQTKWVSGGERIGSGSVEEIIGNALGDVAGSMTMGASGREDRNVRMMGPGRPFYLHLRDIRSENWSERVAALTIPEPYVQVSEFRVLSAEDAALIDAGAAQKKKCYRALIRLDDANVRIENDKLAQLPTEFEITQMTPVRVLHRRSRLPRKRQIHFLKLEPRQESERLFELTLETAAGTYVKEFVHGDMGRTVPSLASLLGAAVSILALDVTDVKLLSPEELAAGAHDSDE